MSGFAGTIAAASDWLSETALSHLMQTVEWLVPAVQTVHILCVAIVFSSVLMLALGTIGLYGADQPLSRRYSRFVPPLRWGLPLLLATGALMVVAEPDRALPNPVFQFKMVLLIVAATVTAAGVRRLAARVASAPAALVADPALRVLALAALLLWAGVLVAGRWIAYSLSR